MELARFKIVVISEKLMNRHNNGKTQKYIEFKKGKYTWQ